MISKVEQRLTEIDWILKGIQNSGTAALILGYVISIEHFPGMKKSVGGSAPPTCYDAGVRRVAMSSDRRWF